MSFETLINRRSLGNICRLSPSNLDGKNRWEAEPPTLFFRFLGTAEAVVSEATKKTWQNKLLSFLDERRQHRIDDARNTLKLSSATRFILSLLPFSCFLVVVLQLYLSGDSSRLLETTGVVDLRGIAWHVKVVPSNAATDSCERIDCFSDQTALNERAAITLPQGDPLALKSWKIGQKSWYLYRASLPYHEDLTNKKPMLYVGGIRGEAVKIMVNDQVVINSLGGTPYFVGLPSRTSGSRVADVMIAVLVEPQASFQGFINTPLFLGDVLAVYRTHHGLEFRSFPRYASIVYLLAVAALTLIFFIFLDHQRELLALSVALSLLGVGQAIRSGVLPSLGTEAYVIVNGYFYVFLIWYALEHMRLNRQIPFVLLGLPIPLFALRFLAINWFGDATAAVIRQFVFDVFASIPLWLGISALVIGTLVRRFSTTRSFAILTSGFFFLVFGAYIIGQDRQGFGLFNFDMLYEIPTIICASVWVINALSNLGSLEERVAKSAEDTRQRTMLEHELALAQEVQETFINAGLQSSAVFEVIALYKAARKVGGDWITWRELSDGYSLAIIGDVVGKGVQAGLVVSACDAALSLAIGQQDFLKAGPEVAIRTIVGSLVTGVFKDKPRRAMTSIIMLADSAGHVSYCTLGHLPLVSINAQGSRLFATRNEWVNEKTDCHKIQIGHFKAAQNDLLLAFTDGLCETSRELKRLVTQWLPFHDKSIEEVAHSFENVEPIKDDVSIMMMRQKKSA